MRGISIYAPLVGLVIVLISVGLALYFHGTEAKYRQTMTQKVESMGAVAYADVFYWDVVSSVAALTLTYSKQALSSLPAQEVEELLEGNVATLFPRGNLVSYFSSLFNASVMGSDAPEMRTEISDYERNFIRLGSYGAVVEELNGYLSFSYPGGTSFTIHLPKLVVLNPVDLNQLERNLELIYGLFPVGVDTFQGLQVNNGVLTFTYYQRDHRGACTREEIREPICLSEEQMGHLVEAGTDCAVETVEAELRSSLTGTGIHVNCTQVEEKNVYNDVEVYQRMGQEDVYSGIVASGFSLERVRCTFEFNVSTAGISEVEVELSVPVPVDQWEHQTPAKVYLHYEPEPCYTLHPP